MKRNLREFKYKSKGSLASLGSKKGVGKIYFFNVKGLLAWIIWRAFYLSFLPSFPTKIRVLLSWILEFFKLFELFEKIKGAALIASHIGF